MKGRISKFLGLWCCLFVFIFGISFWSCGSAPKEQGESCNANKECKSELECKKGTCVKKGVETVSEPSKETTPPEKVGEPTQEAPRERTDKPDASVEPAKELSQETTPDVSGPPETGPPERLPDGFQIPKSIFYRANKIILDTSPRGGFDLNNDKKTDNRLGEILGNSTLKILLQLAGLDMQKTLDDQVNQKQLNMLVELRNLQAPFSPTGKVDVYIYTGKPGKNPGEFTIDPQSVDSFGNANIQYKGVKVDRGLLTAGPGDFNLSLKLIANAPPVGMDLKKAMLQMKISADLSSLSGGRVGGALPAASLDKIEAFNKQTILQLLLTTLPKLTQPDIDLDKDGLETMRIPSGSIECKDGDGITKIKAPSPCPGGAKVCSCAQAPEFQDGFSSSLLFTAGKVTVVK